MGANYSNWGREPVLMRLLAARAKSRKSRKLLRYADCVRVRGHFNLVDYRQRLRLALGEQKVKRERGEKSKSRNV